MENIEKMREAIRARADDLGVEKSKISQQYFEEARKRAEMNAANNRPGGLDLSQISSGNEPKSQKQQWDEELPSMLYDPTDELTEEERKEADPVGQMQIWEQVITELKSAKWPDFLSALREVAVMFAVVAISGVIIIGWDKTLRSVYTDLGMIPRSEDIPGQMAGLDLPEGFTNGMNEEDLAKMAEEMNSKTPGKASRSGSPSVDALMGDSLKDL